MGLVPSEDPRVIMNDNQALLDAGRKVIRFHLGTDILGGLNLLSETSV